MATSDDARSVASDPRAPADERYDAQAELSKAHRPLASALLPREDLLPVIAAITEGLEADAFAKAAQGNVVDFPGRMRPPPKRGMQSVALDTLQIQTAGEYWEKPSGLNFDALRLMVEQTPVLNSVVLTRIRQVQRFCQISEDGGPGFEIRHRDRKHKLTDEEAESCKLLGMFMSNCGWETNPRKRKALRRDNFSSFIAKLTRDTLTMDSAPVECEMKRDRALGIDGIYAVDGATIRLCTEEGYRGDDEIFALQVVQGRIAASYTRDTLIYEVRNPRTDVRLSGYGLGETELLIRVVTGFLNAMNYNIAGFDNNSIPKGLLQLTGDYSEEDLVAFRRMWNSMVKGTNNAWTLPVLVSKDAEGKASYEKFGIDFDEMMFSKWMTFLCSIVCAIYGMAPDEINFESFAASKSSLSGSDTAEKLADSKDKGLRPLMAFWESVFSDYVISEFSDKFCFRWVGLEDEDATQSWEAKKLILTVDELRAEEGYGPHPNPDIGAMPVNPALIGPAMQLVHPEPQQPGTDFGGQPAEGDQDFGPEGDGPPGGAGMGHNGGPPMDANGGSGAPGGGPPKPDEGDFGTGGGGDFGKALTASASTLTAIYSLGTSP